MATWNLFQKNKMVRLFRRAPELGQVEAEDLGGSDKTPFQEVLEWVLSPEQANYGDVLILNGRAFQLLQPEVE